MEQAFTQLAVKILLDDSTVFCWFVYFNSLRPINNLSGLIGTGLPVCNQY